MAQIPKINDFFSRFLFSIFIPNVKYYRVDIEVMYVFIEHISWIFCASSDVIKTIFAIVGKIKMLLSANYTRLMVI